MITELVFKVLFLVPNFIIGMIPKAALIPADVLVKWTGLLELLAIGNQFFPVGQLFLYLSVWLALSALSLLKSFIDWILSIIPLY